MNVVVADWKKNPVDAIFDHLRKFLRQRNQNSPAWSVRVSTDFTIVVFWASWTGSWSCMTAGWLIIIPPDHPANVISVRPIRSSVLKSILRLTRFSGKPNISPVFSSISLFLSSFLSGSVLPYQQNWNPSLINDFYFFYYYVIYYIHLLPYS